MKKIEKKHEQKQTKTKNKKQKNEMQSKKQVDRESSVVFCLLIIQAAAVLFLVWIHLAITKIKISATRSGRHFCLCLLTLEGNKARVLSRHHHDGESGGEDTDKNALFGRVFNQHKRSHED